MGTRFNAVFPNADDELCERLFRMIENEVKRIEAKLSCFDKGSLLAQINDQAFRHEKKLDDEMFGILCLCVEYNKKTFGAFDITMRRLVEHYEKNPQANDTNLGSCFSSIILNHDVKSISFLDEETKIDLGGFGKGYALSRVKKILDDSPIENVFISFGESSVLAKGNHPSGKGWKVGINDYSSNNNSAYTFDLMNESISTSSNYFKDDSGQLIYKTNIINPKTGLLKRDIETISVKSVSPLECEVLSTAFMNLTDEQIILIKNDFNELEVVKINYLNSKKTITLIN